MDRKEAVEIVRSNFPNGRVQLSEALTTLIPELAESEDKNVDDGIRKDLIEFVQQYGDNFYGTIAKASAISWIEKQGERSDFCNKIQIGDKVTRNNDGVLVNLSQLERVAKPNEKQGKETNPYSGISFEYNGHVWGMCARDNGVDILLDKQLFTHLETQGVKPFPLKEMILNVWELGNTYWKELNKGNCEAECGDQLDYIIKHWDEGGHYIKCLENQGEQIPDTEEPVVHCEFKKPDTEEVTDKRIETKFGIEDWIVGEGCICKVIDIRGRFYRLYFPDGKTGNIDIYYADEKFHLWTIEDAKDGDVISWDDSKCIALFRNIYDEVSFNSHGFVGHCTGTFESRPGSHDIEGAHPATKEQRDLLFQKMIEVGYKWDADKKELIGKQEEPKFEEGEWIICNDVCREFNPVRIAGIRGDEYEIEYIDGSKEFHSINLMDRIHRHWTIEDATDGDVLTYHLDDGKILIIIYESLGSSYDGQVNCHALLDGDYFSESAACVCCKFMALLTPATKEQRDLLFQKMDEAGYRWDADEKILKGKQCEQKTEWGEDDDAILNAVIQDIQERHPEAMWRINASKTAAVSTEFVIKWLESFKPQN